MDRIHIHKYNFLVYNNKTNMGVLEMARDNKNYLFAEFKSKEEYKEAYKSVMDKLPKECQFELVVLIERLRITMLCSLEPISKTEGGI